MSFCSGTFCSMSFCSGTFCSTFNSSLWQRQLLQNSPHLPRNKLKIKQKNKLKKRFLKGLCLFAVSSFKEISSRETKMQNFRTGNYTVEY